MNEMLLFRARLAEHKKRLSEMETRADSFISIIREIIDPWSGDFTDFDMDRALVMMNDFHALWQEARTLRALIAKMEKELRG